MQGRQLTRPSKADSGVAPIVMVIFRSQIESNMVNMRIETVSSLYYAISL